MLSHTGDLKGLPHNSMYIWPGTARGQKGRCCCCPRPQRQTRRSVTKRGSSISVLPHCLQSITEWLGVHTHLLGLLQIFSVASPKSEACREENSGKCNPSSANLTWDTFFSYSNMKVPRRVPGPSSSFLLRVLSHFSHEQLFATPRTVAWQAPLSMGILQARILEWVAIPFSRGSS